MARLNKSLVTEREVFARSLFSTGMPVKDVQGELKTKYGKIMSPKRLYELKAAALLEKALTSGPVVGVPHEEIETEGQDMMDSLVSVASGGSV